jgi:hypothetical protein
MKITIAVVILSLALIGCAKPKDGVNGTQGPQGSTGDRGAIGPVGPGGATGNPGIDGQNGRDGSDAHSVTAVKLCVGTTVYPSTFVEYAFCLEGQLYATYSANGGFTSVLPPGLYQSNAIGSSCQFEVQANCVVVAH